MARLDFEKQKFWGTTYKRQSYPVLGNEGKIYEMMRAYKTTLTKAQVKAIKEIEEALGVEFEWEHTNRAKADYFIRTGREVLKELSEEA